MAFGKIGRAIGGLVVGLAFLIIAFFVIDRHFPPDLSRYHDQSVRVLDRDGQLLRIYPTADEHFRFRTDEKPVDQRLIEMLVGFEDRRFWWHPGVDPLALLRALGQLVRHGEVISGGSTITMQVARLLEPRPRTIRTKLIEIFRALQLERRFGKTEILDIYMTLAPYGGPVEGVEAASLFWLNKPPARLTETEAALLVALPQAPSRVRPDRYPERALAARNKVLKRLQRPGWQEAIATPLAIERKPWPLRAPHLADQLLKESLATTISATIDSSLQVTLQTLLRQHAEGEGERVNASLLLIDNRSMEVLAYVGSAGYLNQAREGGNDMIRAIRSPGSTLKPFIYGMAFDRQLLHPASLLDDRPVNFRGYRPQNYSNQFRGEVRAVEALATSLNAPAVTVLNSVGPAAFLSELDRTGGRFDLPANEVSASLAIGLGGLGTDLPSLVRLYAGLANHGVVRPLRYVLVNSDAANFMKESEELSVPLMRPDAARQVIDILRTTHLPAGFQARQFGQEAQGIAFKTGTAYGFRDAWAIGTTPSHTIGVWVGRSDGTGRAGHAGLQAALPLLLAAFDVVDSRDDSDFKPWRAPPKLPTRAPAALARFAPPDLISTRSRPLEILFPADEIIMILQKVGQDVPLEAVGGKEPLHWFIDGNPLPPGRGRHPITLWTIDGPGEHHLLVKDGAGQTARSRIVVVR